MDLIKGMDISMLKELEDLGVKYHDRGIQKDLLTIFKDYGVNAIRLRLWNDPYDTEGKPYGGGTNDLQTTLQLSKRICEYGFHMILDFHYSDFWTDPVKQLLPKAWLHKGKDELAKEVYLYTYNVLKELEKHSKLPEMVQIGNEITKGLLWPVGKLPDVEGMATLLRAGIKAVRDVNRDIKIILHLDFGGDSQMYQEWFDNIEPFQLDYDIIGMSYYPYWHGTLEDLKRNMDNVCTRYQKDVIILETAYGFTTDHGGSDSMIFSKELSDKTPYQPNPLGQAEFMQDLMDTISGVKGGHGLGFVYWEPEWIPVKDSTWATQAGRDYICDQAKGGNSWANQALFDFRGNALPALRTIKKY